MPNRLWEKIKLPSNYQKALAMIDERLMYGPTSPATYGPIPGLNSILTSPVLTPGTGPSFSNTKPSNDLRA